jgi:hypothetical protein
MRLELESRPKLKFEPSLYRMQAKQFFTKHFNGNNLLIIISHHITFLMSM